MKYIVLGMWVLFLMPQYLLAQASGLLSSSAADQKNIEKTVDKTEVVEEKVIITETKEKPGLSQGFDSIKLGASYDEVNALLQKHSSFDYSGEPELSLSPDGKEKIIETRGGRYISRAVFQFKNNKLFSIILDFNASQLDYFTLFTDFSKRYGDTQELSPRLAYWQDSQVRLVLEKPLTIKYILVSALEELIKDKQIQASMQELSREAFINKL